MSKKIKRYKFEREYGNGQGMVPMSGELHPYGGFVLYYDHLEIVKELERQIDAAYEKGYEDGFG